MEIKDEVIETSVVQEVVMTELPPNKDVTRLQDNSNRRRSLRNEEASAKKVKPAKYDEIFNCYRRKNFKECLIYLELVAESTKGNLINCSRF